jgi:acetylornithine/N-succinyldiaminopimelate aminotransferase
MTRLIRGRVACYDENRMRPWDSQIQMARESTEHRKHAMTNLDAVALGKRVFTPNYRQQPTDLVRGLGVYVWDVEGRRYLDMLGGIATCALGHCHPEVVAALKRQADQIWHVSNVFYSEPSLRLAEELCRLSFGKRVFFCNSGAEANEAALKLARRFHFSRNQPERVEIVSAEGSFHGRTLGALAATAQPKYQLGVGPMPPGFLSVPFGDLESLGRAIGPRTAAVILEAIQGEGGVRVAPKGYLARVRELCDAADVLWIADEVQTGMGRTGAWWAYQHEGVAPDIMTLAKALGNGIPIGAMVATERVGPALVAGTHASTFGGNPLACASALSVLKVIERDGLLEAARTAGDYLSSRLHHLKKRGASEIEEIRGRGLLVGVALNRAAAPVVARCRELGMLVNSAGDQVVRFAPALTVQPPELDEAVDIFGRALQSLPAA